jgi:hypothetical protein
MKKLITSLLILFALSANAQNKTLQFGNYFIQIDTATNLWETYNMSGQPFGVYAYSLFVSNNYIRLMDCYSGKIFAFTDTLRAANVTQIGTTGRYRITPNASPLVTSKRNILIGNTIIQYDTGIHTTNIDNKELPIIITNTVSGKVVCKIYGDVIEYNGTLTTPTVFQSTFVKIILN